MAEAGNHMDSIEVRRTGIVLRPDSRRVLFRPFELSDSQRILRVLGRVLHLSEAEVDQELNEVWTEFGDRHQKLQQFFRRRFESVRPHLLTDEPLSDNRQLLIGSYFTQEYALESAALFNPSMVWAPRGNGLKQGERRFIVSLRATGEGHISSLCFRTGTVNASGEIKIDEPTGFVTTPSIVPDSRYDKSLFQRKLVELGIPEGFTDLVLGSLEDSFSLQELEESVRLVLRQNRSRQHDWQLLAHSVISLAKANYEIECDPASDISEHSIFPYSPTETNGIEDARFVEFKADDGKVHYYATYTAYDGNVTFPQLVETQDFCQFNISTLNGPEVKNKGMALFPRKINGRYAMLSRQDGENLYLMYSDMLHFWYTKQLLAKPTYPWEFVQIGNCGSPIETDAGWLVLTHGVGPMRKYSIGAILLDLKDPSRVIGRLPEPLLMPDENEREGYVPNVVYSCGGLVHGDYLILPYAMADYASTFATVRLQPLLDRLRG